MVVDAVHAEQNLTDRLLRWSIYALLIGFAFFYLSPLYVMIVTSVKTMPEIETGNLMALPQEVTGAAWIEAWTAACIGTDCRGMAPFLLNSLAASLPARSPLTHTRLGASQRREHTRWRQSASSGAGAGCGRGAA